MISRFKQILSILTIILMTSCTARDKAMVVKAYQLENENNPNPIDIEKIKILNTSLVGLSYGDTLEINHLKDVLGINNKIASNTKTTIRLLDNNVVRYEKIMKLTPKRNHNEYQVKLDSTKIRLENQLNRLSNLKDEIRDIQLRISELRESSKKKDPTVKYKMIDYYIIASNDSIRINDTLSIMFGKNEKRSFIKNDRYCDFLGF